MRSEERAIQMAVPCRCVKAGLPELRTAGPGRYLAQSSARCEGQWTQGFAIARKRFVIDEDSLSVMKGHVMDWLMADEYQRLI